MILRDFTCDDCDADFEELVDRDADHTRCACGGRASVRFSFSGSVKVAGPPSSSSSTRPSLAERASSIQAKAAPKKRTEDQKREAHQKATANLAREMVQHGGGQVTEAKAQTMARQVADKQLARAAAGE